MRVSGTSTNRTRSAVIATVLNRTAHMSIHHVSCRSIALVGRVVFAIALRFAENRVPPQRRHRLFGMTELAVPIPAAAAAAAAAVVRLPLTPMP